MKIQEFKLRIVQGANNLIDDYFGTTSIVDKLINSTLKIIVKQNTYKIDSMLGLFADENGDVDENIIIEEYSKILGNNGVVLDLRDFINNPTIKNILPDKALVIKQEDLKNIFLSQNRRII